MFESFQLSQNIRILSACSLSRCILLLIKERLNYLLMPKYPVYRELDRLDSLLRVKTSLRNTIVQGLDLREVNLDWKKLDLQGAVFLGCQFPEGLPIDYLCRNGALVFPSISGLPYSPYRSQLYTREELMKGWTAEEDNSVDKKIYDHFVETGKANPHVLEALSRRLHDHAVDDALFDLLEGRVEKDGKKKVVGIMGGHGTRRDDPSFREVVFLARDLTKHGLFIASGGGPGIMEAANLGAYLADCDDEQLEEVLALLSESPHYSDSGYVDAANQVLAKYPTGHSSLAVPTWFYGHEPTNMFASFVAKYFSNSIREDGLLAISTHGVVFAPGSAGTTQEIFMDATQNHYVTFDQVSPMVFLGKERYREETSLFKTISELAKGMQYESMLYLADKAEEATEFILSHPPEAKK